MNGELMSALKPNLSEETLELLDEVYDAELAHDFIENHGENYFLTYYETYEKLVEQYGQEVVDEFAEHFDVDSIEHFEESYQGKYNSGAEFAEQLAIDCGMVSTGISWVEIDWEKSWDNLSYDYTEIGNGYIFCDNY